MSIPDARAPDVPSGHDVLSGEGIFRRHIPPGQDIPLQSNTLRRRSSTDIPRRQKTHFLPALRRAATLMMTPRQPISRSPNTWRSIRAIILSSWFNLFLVFIPISWAIHFEMPGQHSMIFVFAFLAIIPLDKLREFATSELSIRVGHTLADLLNATSGNFVELIVSIIALTKCELAIVQSSLVGSILSNIRMCFFAGGMRFSEQGFGQLVMRVNSSLLTVSVVAVLLHGAFHMSLQNQVTYSELSTDYKILKTSRGGAIILLSMYGSYLVFQQFSHKALYDDDNEDVQMSKAYQNPWRRSRPHRSDGSAESADSEHDASSMDTEYDIVPHMSVNVTVVLLVVVTVLVTITVIVLVDSINGLAESGAVGKEFIGVILLPVVGNAMDKITAVTVAVKDKLIISLGVTIGSSIQIALFVIPFVVVLGWMMNKPLTLLFDPLESVVLFLSVFTVSYVVQDGKSTWLQGMILLSLYMTLAVIFWYYPGTPGIFPDC